MKTPYYLNPSQKSISASLTVCSAANRSPLVADASHRLLTLHRFSYENPAGLRRKRFLRWVLLIGVVWSAPVLIFAQGVAPAICPRIFSSLYAGMHDQSTNGQITRLQQFLKSDPAIYPEGLVTGYFGVFTEQAVQRWQKTHGVVSSGTPSTTGYGVVGPKTLAAIQIACASPVPTPLPGPLPFTIRDRVQTLDQLNVRQNPSLAGAPIGTQPKGMLGAAANGPIDAVGYTWWRIDYDVGPDGWSAGNWLAKAASTPPVPVPVPIPTPIPPPLPIGSSVSVSLNENITHQIMDGLGSEPVTPGFSRPGAPKIYIPPAIVQELYKVFHTDLGYSQSHFHIGIDEPVNDNSDPLSFDWTKFTKSGGYDDFSEYLAYAPGLGLHGGFTFGHTWATLLQQEWLLSNELSPHGAKYKLKEGMEEEYAENILAQALTYKKSGINISHTGIYNEPVWSNNNGRSITPAQMVTIVKRLGQRLLQEGLSTKIHVPEDLSLNHAMLYIKALLADPEARKYIGALSYHTYEEIYADQPADAILNTSGQGNPPAAGVALRAELKQLSKQYGIPVWMTEVSGTKGTPHKIALARANHIHDEFTLADVSLFVPEDFINYKYEGQGEPVNELIGVVLDSAGNYKSHKIMKGGYMMSQYAKFVRPGDVRIDAQSSDKRVRVTAFKNSVNGEIKIVAINNNAYAVPVKIDVTKQGQTLMALEGLRTSANENWVPVMPSVSGNVLTLTLTPESITSLRIK